MYHTNQNFSLRLFAPTKLVITCNILKQDGGDPLQSYLQGSSTCIYTQVDEKEEGEFVAET